MKKLDPKILPYLTALTTAVMLMRAGANYFGLWGWIIGPLAGLSVSLALAYAGSRIGEVADKRKPVAYFALGLLIVLSPLVIYFSEPEPTAGTVVWAMFPDAAVLLASAVAGKSLLVQDGPKLPKSHPQVASKKKKVARKGIKESDLLAYLQANKGASQQEVADHFGVSRQAIGMRLKKLKIQ